MTLQCHRLLTLVATAAAVVPAVFSFNSEDASVLEKRQQFVNLFLSVISKAIESQTMCHLMLANCFMDAAMPTILRCATGTTENPRVVTPDLLEFFKKDPSSAMLNDSEKPQVFAALDLVARVACTDDKPGLEVHNAYDTFRDMLQAVAGKPFPFNDAVTAASVRDYLHYAIGLKALEQSGADGKTTPIPFRVSFDKTTKTANVTSCAKASKSRIAADVRDGKMTTAPPKCETSQFRLDELLEAYKTTFPAQQEEPVRRYAESILASERWNYRSINNKLVLRTFLELLPVYSALEAERVSPVTGR